MSACQVNLTPPFSIKQTEVQSIAVMMATELRGVREHPELARRVLRQGVSKVCFTGLFRPPYLGCPLSFVI